MISRLDTFLGAELLFNLLNIRKAYVNLLTILEFAIFHAEAHVQVLLQLLLVLSELFTVHL